MSNSSSPRQDDTSTQVKHKELSAACSTSTVETSNTTRHTLSEVDAAEYKNLEIDCGESTGKTSECGTPGGPLSDCGNEHDCWSDAASSQRFSSPNPSEHEDGHSDRKPKRRRLQGTASSEAHGPHPKTPTGRPIYPLSERQQMALLLQMTGGTPGGADSPRSPSSVTTPSSAKSARGRTPRVHKRNEHGETPLHIAAIRGDYKLCRRLIKEGADVNCADYAGWAPLHEACNHGSYESAKILLQHGANVNASGLDNDTPLHDAASSNNVQMCVLLLRHGADPDRTNMKNERPSDVVILDEDDGPLLRDILTGKIPWKDHVQEGEPRLSEDDEDEDEADGEPDDGTHKDHNSDERQARNSPSQSTWKDREKEGKQRDKEKPALEKKPSHEQEKKRKRRHVKVHSSKAHEEGKQKLSGRKSGESSHVDGRERDEKRRVSLDFSSLSAGDNVGSGDDSSNDANSHRCRTGSNAAETGSNSGSSTSEKERQMTDRGEKDKLRSEREKREKDGAGTSKKPSQPANLNSPTSASSDQFQPVKVKLVRPPKTEDSQTKNVSGSTAIPKSQEPVPTGPSMPLSSLTKFKEREHLIDKRPSDAQQAEDNEREQKKQLTFKERMEDKKKKPQSGFLSPSRIGESEKGTERKSKKKDIYEFHSSDSDDGSPHPAPAKFAKLHKSQPPSALAKERTPGSSTAAPTAAEPKRKFLIDCPAALNIRAPVFPIRKSTDASAGKRVSTDSSNSGFTSPKIHSAGVMGKTEGKFKFADRKLSTDNSKDSARAPVANLKPFKKAGQGFADKEAIRKQVLSSSVQRSSAEEKKSPVPQVKESKPLGITVSVPSTGERKKEGTSTPTMLSPKLPETPKTSALPDPPVESAEQQSECPPPRVPPLRIVFPPTQEDGQRVSPPPSASVEVKGQPPPGMPYVVPGQGEEDTKETRLTRSRVKQQPTTSKRPADAPEPSCVSNVTAMKTNSMPLRKRRAYGVIVPDEASSEGQQPVEKLPKPNKEDDPSVQAARSSLEGYYDLKKQLMKRWTMDSKNEEVDYKPPPNFESFMINKKNYLIFDKLENSESRALSPPSSMQERLKELYRTQESERHGLRQRHQAEREHLRLLCEKEVMRVHARASRAAAGHLQPALSFCRILLDQDVYNPCVLDKPPPQDVEAKERCSADGLAVWIDETLSRFKTRKNGILNRQRMEALSMHAAQSMEFKAKIRILRMTSSATLPDGPDSSAVPSVEVPDDFYLLPPNPVAEEQQPEEKQVVAA